MILLVRHGETAGNASRILQRSDAPLNQRGLAQAEHLASRLRGLAIAHVLCSDLPRARMTAAPLAGLAPIEDTALLQERNFGTLRGTPYAELPSDPFAPDFEPPGGEGVPAFHARVARAWQLIVERRRGLAGPLVVVTHGLVCRALVERHAQAAALPARFDNAGVSVIDAEPPFAARLINCTQHLPE